MSNWTLRVLTRLALALFVNAAEAGPIASAPLTLERLSLVQLVQFQSFGTNYCTYSDGWNGRGWYRCGDQWNTSFGWAGPFGSSGLSGPAVRRHPPSVTAPKRVYPGYQPSKGRNTGSSVAFPTFGRAPGFRHSGAGGVHVAPNFRVGPAPAVPGLVGGASGNVHQFHGAGVPRIGARPSLGVAGSGFHGVTGAGAFHAPGGAGVPRMGAPALPGVGKGFRAPGAPAFGHR